MLSFDKNDSVRTRSKPDSPASLYTDVFVDGRFESVSPVRSYAGSRMTTVPPGFNAVAKPFSNGTEGAAWSIHVGLERAFGRWRPQSFSSRIQTLRNRTGLLWSWNISGPLSGCGAYSVTVWGPTQSVPPSSAT